MMRSSSMLVTRARSVRNINKVPFKFRFEINAGSVDRVAGSGDVVLVWHRTSKVISTAPTRLDTANRCASFSNAPLTAEVTLFKTAATDRRFHDKVIKISLRAGSPDGKNIAKLHLNLADYAEVPFLRRKISAEMDGGPVLLASVNCTFLSTGKAASSLRGPPPTQKEKSLALSSDEENPEKDPEFSSVAPSDGNHSSFLKSKLKMKRSPSKNNGRKQRDVDSGSGGSGDGSADAELERANKENARLKKQIEEAERFKDGKVFEDNRLLKRELEELKLAVAREPVYSDIVRELKDTKMNLAMVQLEKEKITEEMAKFKSGRR